MLEFVKDYTGFRMNCSFCAKNENGHDFSLLNVVCSPVNPFNQCSILLFWKYDETQIAET